MSPLEAPALLDTPMHGVVVLGETISDCNERFCRILDYERQDIIGVSLLDLSPQIQADGAFSRERWQRRWQAARGRLLQWFPWQFRNSRGRRVHALVHLTTEGAGENGLIAHVHDLSHLRDAGWIKPESYARLQDVLDHTKAVIFVKGRDGRYIFANRELERVVRIPAERIVGHTDRDLWPRAIAGHFRANDEQVLLMKRAFEFEVTADVARQRRTFLSFKFPLFDPDGEPYAVCGIATDITDRKRTQDALTSAALAVSSAQGSTVLRELVRYLATSLEADAAMIAVPHEDDERRMRTHALFVDGKLVDDFDFPLAGTPCETVAGRSFRIYPSGVCRRFPGCLPFMKTGFEGYAGFPLHSGSGACIGVISVASRTPMMNAEFVESILKIVAVRAAAELESQHAEQSLRRSEASYRAIFEASEDAIFVHDSDTGAIIDVNRRACEVYGYGYDEMKRLTWADMSSGEHPYTGAEAANWLEQAKGGKPVRFEWHRRNKDGTLHWDEVVLRAAVIAGERRILAFTREITERKQAEQAMRQAQKMEALGHLTGGIAHDFNNLLTSIMGYIVLATQTAAAASDGNLEKYLEQAQCSCTRARDLVRQMLTFSRGQRGRPRPVDMSPLVREAMKLFASSLPSAVDVEMHLERELPAVMLDPVQLDQMLLNLCLNARDAMGGAGVIRVSVSRATGGEHICTACRARAAGPFIELCVEDTGCGIAPDIVDRIFEPFFTTKETGKGSGMGLASVHGIVHELGGHVVVDTAPGRGTRFGVLFPALTVHAESAARQNAPSLPQARTLRGHVLVVDDEPNVARFMQDLLESWHLTVTVSASAAEAAAIFARDPQRLDLVITDQMMPRKTGVQLARALHAARPGLPIFIYTGFNEETTRAEAPGSGVRAVLTKPVDADQLFNLLKTHLPVMSAAAESASR